MQDMRKLFQPEIKDISLTNVLYALSDPNRLQIVRTLAESENLGCNKFDLMIAKSTQSHHFKVLREAGVTETRIEGTQHYIYLRRDDLEIRFPGLLQAVLNATEPL